jgi:D-glycero-D-manno-heptose 1,7-bisphosphate phosphatase
MKGIFLDRDGVINELVYYHEHGVVDSPFTAAQFRLLPGVAEAINEFHEMDFQVVVVSNQPGIAKRYISEETFEEIKAKMENELAREGAAVDETYYCFHHPDAKIEKLRVSCDCRKPDAGLLLRAAREMDLELSQSWMIGDGLTDVEAGKKAGCRTILLGRMKCELCHLMDDTGARPDFVAQNLLEAANLVRKQLVMTERQRQPDGSGL